MVAYIYRKTVEYMKIAEYKPDTSLHQRTADSLTNEQQKQSYKYIVKRISHGSYIDISDNDYLDVYLSELNTQLRQSLVAKDTDSISQIAKNLSFIIDHYQSTHAGAVRQCYPSYVFALHASGRDIRSALEEWLIFLNQNGWYTNSNDIIIALYTTFCDVATDDYVDAKYFGVFATVDINKYLTSFGSNHLADIEAIMSDLLNRDYQISNENYVNKMYKFEEGEVSVIDHAGMVGGDHVFDLHITTTARKTEYDEGIYSIKTKVPVYTPQVRDSYVKNIVREAELILRQETGVEHRWISESVLFKQIQSAFKNHRVKKHASPRFLGRQHYDVYLPELKIALEYQGEQHFRPIPFFGGEAGFIETQKRDRRKRKLSEDNGIYQINVLPGYDIAKVLEKILQHHEMRDYDLDALTYNARTLTGETHDTLEPRESVVARINLDHKASTDDDNNLRTIIERLIQRASNTKIGQRKLTTEAILRYQGLCSKYMRTGEHEKELEVRIMMYARGVKSYSFDEYWREKELIKMIGVENYIVD